MPRDAVHGAPPATVRAALADADPLPGTAGFAGALDSSAVVTAAAPGGAAPVAGRGGRVVRDALGREPVFVDGDRWSRDPARLADPRPVGAGRVVDLDAPGAADRPGGDATPATATGDETPPVGTRVWTLPDPPPDPDHDAAVAAVRSAVLRSVGGVDPADLAVAFSGGVDSALVAAGVDAPCYVAGFPDAHDVAAARRAADEMGLDLRVVELAHADLVDAVPRVVAATGRTNPMDVAIALPLVLVAERARADGFSRLAVGQGADELFGGYAKVADPAGDDRVAADTVRGARRETVETLPRQLERDVLALRAAGVDPVAPFLHDRVVRAALSLPGDLLAASGERKVALRRAAAGLVPESVARADKKAVQYGSLVSRELDRLARRAGFKRRMDDHVGRYVRSLVDDGGEGDRDAATTGATSDDETGTGNAE